MEGPERRRRRKIRGGGGGKGRAKEEGRGRKRQGRTSTRREGERGRYGGPQTAAACRVQHADWPLTLLLDWTHMRTHTHPWGVYETCPGCCPWTHTHWQGTREEIQQTPEPEELWRAACSLVSVYIYVWLWSVYTEHLLIVCENQCKVLPLKAWE